MNPFSIYIHVPYCHSKCPYCDFNVYAVKEVPEQSYVDMILKEWALLNDHPAVKQAPLVSIFFGGGTPSFLSTEALSTLLGTIRADCSCIEHPEFCLEANPQDCTREFAREIQMAGFNRVSLGSQTLSSSTLSILGRKHSPQQVYAAIEHFRNEGLSNISIDMMFGVPGQSVKDIKRELGEVLALSLPHLSTYQLTIEQGTPFYVAERTGRLVLPPEDETVVMMRTIHDDLCDHGYRHYEISNFAQEGYESVHNLGYWTARNYLGLGPGAHSFLQYKDPELGQQYLRRANLASPDAYNSQISQGKLATAWHEHSNLAARMAEFVMLGLRTQKGVCPERFQSLFGYSFIQCYEEELLELQDRKLITTSPNGAYTLTWDGIILADSVTGYFVDPSCVNDAVQPEAEGKRSKNVL